MKCKEYDIRGHVHKIDGEWILPHAHLGYFHGENGTRKLTPEEKQDVDIILREWYNFKRRK